MPHRLREGIRVPLVAAAQIVGGNGRPTLTAVERMQQPEVGVKAVGDDTGDSGSVRHGIDDPEGMVATGGSVKTVKWHDRHSSIVPDGEVTGSVVLRGPLQTKRVDGESMLLPLPRGR